MQVQRRRASWLQVRPPRSQIDCTCSGVVRTDSDIENPALGRRGAGKWVGEELGARGDCSRGGEGKKDRDASTSPGMTITKHTGSIGFARDDSAPGNFGL